MDTSYHRQIIITGWLGIAAAIFVGVGEFLLHYNPDGYDSGSPHDFFMPIPEWRITAGHFLAVLFVPLYLFGYWHVYLSLRKGSKRLAKAVLVTALFAFVIGGIWIGSRAMLAIIVQSKAEAGQALKVSFDRLLEAYDRYMKSLLQVLRVLVLMLSAFFVWAVLKGGTLYPKWMAIFNPIVLLALVFLTYVLIPPVGYVLTPTAMNVAHLVFFGLSLSCIMRRDL